MARTRIWSGAASGVFSHHLNWETIGIRTAAYAWTASGSGTNEYYLRTAGGADPAVGLPDEVTIDGVAADDGSPGSLAAGEWGYGDNDTLGYSTVYVRLADGADPDSKAAGFITYTGAPRAGENVSIPVGAANITGEDYSGVALGVVRFEDGTAVQAGSAAAYLQLTCAGFYFAGKGVCSIDLAGSAISPEVRDTANKPAEGVASLYLKGVAIDTLKVVKSSGPVALAWRAGESSRVDTVEALPPTGQPATVWIGPAVTDVADSGDIKLVRLRAGATVVSRSDVLVIEQKGGDYTQQEGVWNTAALEGGITRPDGEGTYTSTEIAGGSLLTEGSANLKTFTDATVRKGSTLRDPMRRITWTNPIKFPDGLAALAAVPDFGSFIEFQPVPA